MTKVEKPKYKPSRKDSKPAYRKGAAPGKPAFGGKKPPGKKYLKKAPEPKPALTRKDRKELKKKRKAQKKNADVAEKVNTIYSKNISQLDRPERIKMASEIVEHAKGKIFELSFRHDTSRALQLIIKHGTAEQRNSIFEELKGKFLDLAKNRSGTFIILKISQYCTNAHKEALLLELRGNFRRLALLNDSAQIMDHLYATSQPHMKYYIIRELLDKSFGSANVIDSLHFKTENATRESRRRELLESMPPAVQAVADWDEAELKKNPDKILAWLIARDPERRSLLFDSVEVFLNRAIDKELLMYRFYHAVLLQYMALAPITMSSKRDLISSCCNYLLALHESKEGALAASLILGYATVRDRKNAIRYIKGRVMDLALHPTGYLILLKLIHVTDDSVLLRKSVFSEFLAQPPFGSAPFLFQLLTNKYGAKIFQYLFAKEHTSSIFNQEELELLRPVWVLNLKTKVATQDKNDDNDDDDAPKANQKADKLTEKEYETITHASEKERLQRKLDDEREAAEQAKDAELVKTSKKDVGDKVIELGAIIVREALETLLLSASKIMGIDGFGTLATSNVDITDASHVDQPSEDEDADADEDDEEEDYSDEETVKAQPKEQDDEDDEDSSSDEAEPESHLRQDIIQKLPQYAVLDGVIKDRVGIDTVYALLSASAQRFEDLTNKGVTKGPIDRYRDAIPVLERVLEGLSDLAREGKVYKFDPNISRKEFQNSVATQNQIQTKDGIVLSDDSHPFTHGKAHLFFKRLVSAKSIGEKYRAPFVKQLWDTLSSNTALLKELVTQNRAGFVLSSLVGYNNSIRQAATKALTTIIGSKNLKVTGKQGNPPPGLDALYRVLLGGHPERTAEAPAPTPAPSKKEIAKKESNKKENATSTASKRKSMEPTPASVGKAETEASIKPAAKRTKAKKTANKVDEPVPEEPTPQPKPTKGGRAKNTQSLIGGLKLNLGGDSDDDADTKPALEDEPEPEIPLTPRRSARLRGMAPPDLSI